MEPWYKVVTPRKEVREGRSFNPDEFAIHLEQVVSGKAPEDYRDPVHFFSRTCFTKALREHAGMVLRRLAGKTTNTAPVLTLVTQFGGGKTHTLTALYHIASNGAKALGFHGVKELIEEEDIGTIPQAKVAAFVGNAWDPRTGRETPWIDLAYQLAGEKGVAELGPAAKTIAPGTDTIARIFELADGPVLILFDEVLNFINRHRGLADGFYAFIQNLTVATTGASSCATVISLPRSQVEMTESDYEWQTKITKVVRRVAKDLIVNEESEIGEVIKRRLFEDIGNAKTRKAVCKQYADWYFDKRSQLPPEWMIVDSSATENDARKQLQSRFEACYPFHPAVLSVFQRKWQTLPQYQQTRGTLAMLAQWISWEFQTQHKTARKEHLIMLGSAPLEVAGFRSIVLGQIGETRLGAAIETDITSDISHAKALDADAKGELERIHKRVATAIFFESSGGLTDKLAHLPEVRFAVCGPGVDTTTVDNAARALEDKCYYLRRIGTDGFQIHFKPTLRKIVHDRKASLDDDTEIMPTMLDLVKKEFSKDTKIPIVFFPADETSIPDSPKLILIVMDPRQEWSDNGNGRIQEQVLEWTKKRGKSPRLYPGALVWCLTKSSVGIRDKVVNWLAWRRVREEERNGLLGKDIDESEIRQMNANLATSESAAREEVWASYRFVVLFDSKDLTELRIIDLGAGHSSANETLSGRVIQALKSQSLLNESIGAGYIDRNWPPAFKDTGAWPLSSLRGSFLNGSLTRLIDPDTVLRYKIPEFVEKSEFALASDPQPDGSFRHLYFGKMISPEDVTFDSETFLVQKKNAEELTRQPEAQALRDQIQTQPDQSEHPESPNNTKVNFQSTKPKDIDLPDSKAEPIPVPEIIERTLKITGEIPPETWNRFGTKIVPKLRSAKSYELKINLSVNVDGKESETFYAELQQLIDDLGLTESIKIE